MLDHFDAVVGEWETEATHPYSPDAAIQGSATFGWLDGRPYLSP
jgi:hypothetical protein